MRTDFKEVKSVFGFRVRLQKIQNLNLDFPIERNQRKIRRRLFTSSTKREVFSRRSRAETAEKCFALK